MSKHDHFWALRKNVETSTLAYKKMSKFNLKKFYRLAQRYIFLREFAQIFEYAWPFWALRKNVETSTLAYKKWVNLI